MRKIVIIFLSISLNMCFVCSKDETVLLSTHNICFVENKKISFSYAILSGGLKSLINIGDRCCGEGGYSSLRYKVPYSSS